MILSLSLFGICALLFFIASIISIVVLIKQFIHGGALHGLLGLFTGGLWTFIWGWIKSREFQLTKLMLAWTFLPLLGIGLAVFAFTMGSASFLSQIKNRPEFRAIMQPADMAQTGQKGKIKVPRKQPVTPIATNNSNQGQATQFVWRNGEYADPQIALKHWDGVIRANPKSAEAYNNRGLAHAGLQQYQRAIKDYGQAILLKADFPEAYNNRGISYYDLNRYDLAVKDYSNSIQLQPDYAKAFLNRGLAYYQMEKNTQACADLNKACDLNECEGLNWAQSQGMCQ